MQQKYVIHSFTDYKCYLILLNWPWPHDIWSEASLASIELLLTAGCVSK